MALTRPFSPPPPPSSFRGGRYLTSNVLNSTTEEPLANTHVILRGSVSDVSVLVFGFLYHQTDSCLAVSVVDPKVAAAQPWFAAALKDGIEAQYLAEGTENAEPRGRSARRKAAYVDAIGDRSDWHDRMDQVTLIESSAPEVKVGLPLS